jgi:type IX secretion system PorP/SprF family membrane protein
MKLKIIKIVPIIVLLISSVMQAQQDAQFTQYMYNTVVINPAYAGSRNVLSINGVHRSQWIGLEGAPKTQTLSIHSPIGQQLGMGLTVVSDELGPSTETYAHIDISYTLPLNSEGMNFAFGVKGGFYSLNVDFNKLLIYNPTDAAIQNNNINNTSPVIGVGGYLYTNKWYVGVSTPNLLETDHYTNATVSRASETMHLYGIAGYVFDVNPNLKFKPATMIKMVKGAPLSFDISANFLIRDKITLGTSYRLDAAISGLAGFQISESMMLGYAYDLDTTDIRGYSSGSHEFFLRYEFITRVKGKVSPRFF